MIQQWIFFLAGSEKNEEEAAIYLLWTLILSPFSTVILFYYLSVCNNLVILALMCMIIAGCTILSVRYGLSLQNPSCTQMTSLQKNQTDMAGRHTFHTLFYMSAS